MTEGSSRTRRRRKEARPAEIAEAGLAAFVEHGFAATRMEEVARRAGVAKGTVFRYFPTKEALFEAAVLSRAAPVWDGAETMASTLADMPLREAVIRLIEALHAGLTRPEITGLMRIIIAEGPRFPALLETWHRLSISRARGILQRLVNGAVARGEIAPGPLTDLPMVLVAPGLMAALWQMTFARIEPIALDRFRDAHFDLLQRALAPRLHADSELDKQPRLI